MHKRYAILITLIAALVAIGAPIVVALALAAKQAHDSVAQLALAYARDVVHRSDATADQVWTGIVQLQEEARHSGPCSAASIKLMRKIALESSYIQAIGHVSGTQMDCASMDAQGHDLELGLPELTQPTGVRLRYHAELPLARGIQFIVIEAGGYAAVIHKTLPVDVTLSAKDLSVATITSSGYVLTSSGYLDRRWVKPLGKNSRETTFIDGGYMVAVVPSKTHFIDGIAALPISRISAGTRSAALLLVPAGIVAGILLALAVLYLGKLQLGMPALIRTGLKRKEFSVVYQPIVDLQSGQWVGAEALIRWRRPTGETIRPDLFISVAEEAGLIQRITEWVVRSVGRDAIEIFRHNPDFHVSINLSAADLHSPSTVQLFRRLLLDTEARPGSVVVEVTERGLSKPEVASAVIQALRASGVRVAVDDFGTGYSSLSYLERFKLDYLKIDKSFVDTVGTQAATSQVATHIIEMAKALKLVMVAEGVETPAQAEFLRGRGVEYAQGFLFSKPLPFAELLSRIPRSAPASNSEPYDSIDRTESPAI